jgi:hypothetical protein
VVVFAAGDNVFFPLLKPPSASNQGKKPELER